MSYVQRLRRLTEALLSIVLCCSPVSAYGPKTEAIIPIGLSPGLSGVCTTMGTFLGFDVLSVTESPQEAPPFEYLHLVIDTAEGLIYEPIALGTEVWINGKSAPHSILNLKSGMPVEMKGIGCCILHLEKYPDSEQPCTMWIKATVP